MTKTKSMSLAQRVRNYLKPTPQRPQPKITPAQNRRMNKKHRRLIKKGIEK